MGDQNDRTKARENVRNAIRKLGYPVRDVANPQDILQAHKLEPKRAPGAGPNQL